MKLTTRLTTLAVAPATISSLLFSPPSTRSTCTTRSHHRPPPASPRSSPLHASESNDHEDAAEKDGLVLDGLDREMGKMASKFSFTESDFLAAAKKRAAERVESRNASAGDDDWKTLAERKKNEMGEIDDWENSKKEAGNEDSQILMFTEPPADGEDGGSDDGEPKLLLF